MIKDCAKCIHYKVCASYLEDMGLISDSWEHDMSLCCEDFADSSQFAPVAHGYWKKAIDNSTHMHECSVCGARVVKGLYEHENPNLFCYHCGSRMNEFNNTPREG